MRRLSLRSATVLACLLATLPLAAQTPHQGDVADNHVKRLYAQGTKAADDGDWTQVRDVMLEVIQTYPFEDAKGIRVGTRGLFEPFVPYYYLGLAYFRLESFEEATDAWRESERHGALSDRSLATQLAQRDRLLPQANDRVALAGDLTTAESRLSQAERAAQDLQRRLDDSPIRASASFLDDQRSVQQLINSGRSQLDEARSRQQRAAARKAIANADDALDGLRSLDADLDQQIAAFDVPPQTPETDVAKTDGRPASTTGGQTQEGGAGRPRTSDRSAETSTTIEPDDPRISAATATSASESDGGRPQVPNMLRGAAEAFFNARYTEAVRQLSSDRGLEGRSRIQFYWLRAASQFAQYLVGDQQAGELLEAAKRDARECRQLDATFEPDDRYFSPRISRLLSEI